MEEKKQEIYAFREHSHSRYDKRLILKIVGEVEAGLPRREATRIYGLGKNTLDSWMPKYGSPVYHQAQKRQCYTNLQKRTIVRAIEQGRMSVNEARTAYNIKSDRLIRNWIKQFKAEKTDLCAIKEQLMAKDTKPADLQAEALQKALEEAEMKIRALNTLIDIAEQQLKIDIRKKSGARQSSK